MKSEYRISIYLGILVVGVMLFAGMPESAGAHETREVEDEFEFVVGFTNEPAYVNEMNGLELRISYLNGGEEQTDDDQNEDQDGSEASPVEGAHQTLEAQIQFAGETRDLELREVWDEPGAYTADVIPTETGAYSFQIMGEIDGTEINETFTAGPDTFSEIEPRTALEFPGNGEGDVAGGSGQTAAFGIAGVTAGLIGLALGGAALYKVSTTGEPTPAQRRRQQKQAEQKQRDDED